MPFLSRIYARIPVIALVHHVHREQWPVVMGLRWMASLGWWIESRLAVRIYRSCRYVAVSEATKSELAMLGVSTERVTVVHNGTPELQQPLVERDPHPSLMVLGRLVPHKRVEIAMRTVARLKSHLPDLRLTIAGSGWWEPQLRQAAIDLDIVDRVHFAGFISDEEKRDLLARSWVALTPSLKEGWGLTIVEAALMRTPTIAFAAAGGVAEALVDGKTGLLARDEEHFIALVRELLTDSSRRETMGELAHDHAGSFTWQAAGDRFAELVAAPGIAAVKRAGKTARNLRAVFSQREP
jgi:glycosyltransferase involved in cell wall biosynthesis